MNKQLLILLAIIIATLMTLAIFLPAIRKISFKEDEVLKSAFSDKLEGDTLKIIYSGRLYKKDVLLKPAKGDLLKILFILRDKKTQTKLFDGTLEPYEIVQTKVPQDTIGYLVYYGDTKLYSRTLVN